MIAELARLARGRVLVLAHVKELVEQNHAKYLAYGLQADIFAAGLNRKESQSKVVFGSVQSVARNLKAFDAHFSLVIIDECHRISLNDKSQYQQIIQVLQANNPSLRILGLTATLTASTVAGFTNTITMAWYVVMKIVFRECIYELPTI